MRWCGPPAYPTVWQRPPSPRHCAAQSAGCQHRCGALQPLKRTWLSRNTLAITASCSRLAECWPNSRRTAFSMACPVIEGVQPRLFEIIDGCVLSRILPPEKYLKAKAGSLVLGRAPDGLRVVSDPRSEHEAEDLLWQAKQALGIQGKLDGTPLQSIADKLGGILRTQVAYEIGGNRVSGERFIVLPRRSDSYFGSTMLALLIGAPPVPFTHHTRIFAAQTVAAKLVPAISIADGRTVIVTRDHRPGEWPPSFKYVRDYQTESIYHVPDAMISAADSSFSVAADPETYTDLRILNPEPRALHLDVARNTVASIILKVTKQLAEIHARGKLHGDMKADHVILTSDGIILIDSGELEPGATHYGVTPGWASPEQILNLPLGFQTDQYPIGLMLLTLLAGSTFGPTLTTTREYVGFEIKYDPQVRCGGETVGMEFAEPWRRLIERCLKFRAEDRFSSMTELAGELEYLCRQNALEGHLSAQLNFGECVTRESGSGTIEPYWKIDSSWVQWATRRNTGSRTIVRPASPARLID